jgi:magnesium chelatase subunit I
MTQNAIKTLGELRASGWKSTSVKDELERNLVRKLEAGETIFPGIIGYETTVLPQVLNAILAHHDMVFLGEKGQAKSRLMRGMVALLDEAIPYVAGCDLHDDPFKPICSRCKRVLAEQGDSTPIAWWAREDRYGERLAPGTKVADLIGDLDPAKVAGGTTLSSEEALHFGLIPRFNRGIFAINELPDLDYLIQVSLFNILEERDIQIRGYPLRFDLDVALVFTANPDEYSRSGKIITQLKDRIGAEIRTHYPRNREVGIQILEQEARRVSPNGTTVEVPEFMTRIVEQITMEARNSPYVNHKSGVSARLSITNYETMIANARRRALTLREKRAVPRMCDLASLYTSTSGKIELDPFREETVTEYHVISKIVEKAVRAVFMEYFAKEDFSSLVLQFKRELSIKTSDQMPSAQYSKILDKVPQIWEPVHILKGNDSEELRASCIEFILEGLHVSGKLSRAKTGDMVEYLQGGKS